MCFISNTPFSSLNVCQLFDMNLVFPDATFQATYPLTSFFTGYVAGDNSRMFYQTLQNNYNGHSASLKLYNIPANYKSQHSLHNIK